MTKIQAKKLLRLADFLEFKVAPREKKIGHKKLDMNSWFSRPDGCKLTKPSLSEAGCGTTACAMGWATTLFGRQGLRIVSRKHWLHGHKIYEVVCGRKCPDGFVAAERFFGLSADESETLFMGSDLTSVEEAKRIRNFVKKSYPELKVAR